MHYPSWLKVILPVAVMVASVLPLSARNNQEEDGSKPKNTYTPKIGLALSVNTTLADLSQTPHHPLAPYLNANEGFNFSIFRNSRLLPGIYYQPEIAYMVYNGVGNQRYTFISAMPAQFQLGIHFGWIRPYVSGGAFANMAFSARDEEGMMVKPGKWTERLSWGYSYGAGVDLLSRLSLQYRRKFWMNDFQSLQPGRLSETCLIASFLF